MPIDSVTTLVAVLRDKRILLPDQLDELARSIQNRFSEARTLAKYLVQRGWLTIYQVNQLFQENGQNLVLGPYRILDQLGEGGVSQVFKAWDTRKQGVVTLKVIRPELLSNPEALGRFQREIQMVAQLSHPNIVQASDVNHVGEMHFFAMEFVEGADLGKLVQLSGPLPVPQACDFIRQAALGLDHAHERGLVHRDIKPANLLLIAPAAPAGQANSEGRAKASAPSGTQIKILDMGLARLLYNPDKPDAQSPLTMEGMMIGTADYLPPEQARDARGVDKRADIYSLGCTFYYLLTGQPPFPGGSVLQKVYMHQKVDPTPVASARSEVPPGVSAIVKKMMAKRPEDRYQNAAEVAAALAPFCKGGGS